MQICVFYIANTGHLVQSARTIFRRYATHITILPDVGKWRQWRLFRRSFRRPWLIVANYRAHLNFFDWWSRWDAPLSWCNYHVFQYTRRIWLAYWPTMAHMRFWCAAKIELEQQSAWSSTYSSKDSMKWNTSRFVFLFLRHCSGEKRRRNPIFRRISDIR